MDVKSDKATFTRLKQIDARASNVSDTVLQRGTVRQNRVVRKPGILRIFDAELLQDAYNVEPDPRGTNVEVDNTKELILEEALRLYQTALKLHAGGKKNFKEAGKAYSALFKSTVFKGPEAATEFDRFELNPGADFNNDFLSSAVVDLEPDAEASSSLVQLMYLAYRNKGEFIMDCVKAIDSYGGMTREELRGQVKSALENFIKALARDESDTELWRKAARLANYLGSTAVSRYCLEAAVENDDDPTLYEAGPTSLGEDMAGIELNDLLKRLEDSVALSHPIQITYNLKKTSKLIRKHLDPYPWLPDLDSPPIDRRGDTSDTLSTTTTLSLVEGSWTSLSEALWQKWQSHPGSGLRVMIDYPEYDKMTDKVMESVAEAQDVRALPIRVDSARSKTGESLTSPDASANATATLSPGEGQAEMSLDPEPESGPASRKRSQSVAGLHDTPDEDSGTQKRSKRIRNRDTNGPDTISIDPIAQFNAQLEDVKRADIHTFEYVGSILEKLGVTDLGSAASLQDAAGGNKDNDDPVDNTAIKDMRTILMSWNDNKASLLWKSSGSDVKSSNGDANKGMIAFLEHSKSGGAKPSAWLQFPSNNGLLEFINYVNKSWMPLQDVVYAYLKVICPSYTKSIWPEPMKNAICRLVNLLDGEIYSRLREDTDRLDGSSSEVETSGELVQFLFELHLDIFAQITNPESVVDFATRKKEEDSLYRWGEFAEDLLSRRACRPKDELHLRLLWAFAYFVGLQDDADRDYTIAAWKDMRAVLEECGGPDIQLQNNAVMPEITTAAADREISRLTTMDFFMNLFQSDKSQPTGIIETLEPVLDPQSVGITTVADGNEPSVIEGSTPRSDEENSSVPSGGLRDMWKFLQAGSTSLRLFLWQRLREAYEAIDYKTKVFSCYLRSIEIIVADFKSPTFVTGSIESRHHALLGSLKALDDLLVKALTLAVNDKTAFEIIDDAHLKSSCSAMAQLVRLLHSVATFNDGVRVGLIQLPSTPPYAVNSGPYGFPKTLEKLGDMQVRSWTLLYTLVKDGIDQNGDLFSTPELDLGDFLAAVHQTLGLRKYCKFSAKIFLKVAKSEMLRMKSLEPWEDYLGQILFDLYGLRLGTGTWEIQDHDCPEGVLEKRTALAIAPRIIDLANRMSLRDLLKSELRSAIERIQQAIGAPRVTVQMQHNLRNVTEFLKGSVIAMKLDRARQGVLQVDTIPVTTTESPLADKGWYFLLGMIALTKYRAQKRLASGATDDLQVAATFFRLQLQFTAEHWESWYRLAQCFDAELEENVISAEKLNSTSGDERIVITAQRSAIHCYSMAASKAVSNADTAFETAGKISEMYFDFGMRIYSSARAPFQAQVFWMNDFNRYYNDDQLGVRKKLAHSEITKFTATIFAARFFRKALAGKPDFWMNHYMLGKCLWKMYSRQAEQSHQVTTNGPPTVHEVIECFTKAVEKVPKPRDSRSDPILEPHCKLMSVIHKLVTGEVIDPQEGASLLQKQPYAIQKGESISVTSLDMWKEFALKSFRNLRNVDKANWQHRIIYRVAKILCPNVPPEPFEANLARVELKDSMFTKTMVVQVWKPEFERPGRHCVYMSRYVKFMLELLLVLDDKPNMEALVRRVRKKEADYFDYSEIWSVCCKYYLTLMRRLASVAPNQDDALKAIPGEDFAATADALDKWCNDPESSHPALDCLREATELRKLNQGLAKQPAIDDLISDAFATLYFSIGFFLPRQPAPVLPSQAAPGPMSLNVVMNADGEYDQTGLANVFRAGMPGSEVRPRVRGASRREVLRRAEAIVVRVPEAKSGNGPSKESKAGQGVSKRQPRNLDVYLTGKTAGGVDASAVNQKLLRLQEAEEGDQSSAPGSVHDSADDESDLSDVPEEPEEEEEEASIPMFPNLSRIQTEASKTEDDEEDDGDE